MAEEPGAVVLEKGRDNVTEGLSLPAVPQLLSREACLSNPASPPQHAPLPHPPTPQHMWRHSSNGARRKDMTWNTAWLPSGLVFHGSFWTQSCLRYKLWVNCGLSSCGRGPCDKVFLSEVHVAFCHSKVQHMDLLRSMHQVYFLTSKWINFSDSIGNERKITCFWSYPKIWFLWSGSCNLTTTTQSSESSGQSI